jgi:Acetyltransferase (GNAT) domain
MLPRVGWKKYANCAAGFFARMAGGHNFRGADTRFYDPDSSDPRYFHIIARHRSKLAGCVRVAPLKELHHGVVSSAINEDYLTSVLSGLGTTRERACESSRWVVTPEFRGELGPRLAAAAWALARSLSMDIALVMAGTWQKQDLALIRMGARPVNGVPLVSSETFRGKLRLLYFDVVRPTAFMQRRIERAAADLKLMSPPGTVAASEIEA